jgi:polysaccharide export outer membrane protein
MQRIALVFTLLALLCGSAAAGAAQGPPAESPRNAWSDKPLRPGDIIRLRIWREPDLSGEFPINEDGIAVLPRLGPTRVAGESPQQLQIRLVKQYERYLQQTSIEVTLLRRIQVLGAVRNPGLHPVDATMTVSDVLALAGGTTPQGDPDRIQVIRAGQRIDARLSTNARIVDSAIESGDQIFVPERNWFSRNSAVIAAGLTSLVITLFRR